MEVGALVSGIAFCAFGVIVIATRKLSAEMRVKWDREHAAASAQRPRRTHEFRFMLVGVMAMAAGVAFIVLAVTV